MFMRTPPGFPRTDQLSPQRAQSLRCWRGQIWTCEGELSGGDREQKHPGTELQGEGLASRQQEQTLGHSIWVARNPGAPPPALEATLKGTSASQD